STTRSLLGRGRRKKMARSNANRDPIAFLSYVRADDQHEGGRLTQLRESLEGEVRMQTGASFPIFQDRADIAGGQHWRQAVDSALASARILTPVITPGFFNSEPCREDLRLFLDREKQLGRDDLILPIYYVTCRILSDEKRRAGDELAEIIAARQ